jgi:hypothetical protein
MSMAAHGDLGSFPSDLGADQRRAERLLSELAKELLRVPVDEHTRVLHLRALALKRAVMGWPDAQPPQSIRHAVVREVLSMQDEALVWRRSGGVDPTG